MYALCSTVQPFRESKSERSGNLMRVTTMLASMQASYYCLWMNNVMHFMRQ